MFLTHNFNQSLWTTVARAMGANLLTYAHAIGATILAATLAVLTAFTIRRSANEKPITWATRWLLLVLLANPLSWRWGSLVCIGFPLAVTMPWKPNKSKTSTWLLWGLIAAFLLFQQNMVVRAFGIEHWTTLHDFGFITGFWLTMLVASLIAPAE
jgi:hypothetical protein